MIHPQLIEHLRATPPLSDLAAALAGGTAVQMSGATAATTPWIAAAVRDSLSHRGVPALWITPSYEAAERLYDDLAWILTHQGDGAAGPADILLFPEREASALEPETTGHLRLQVMERMAAGGWALFIAPVRALLEPSPDLEEIRRGQIILTPGRTLPLETLIRRLAEQGYDRVSMVERRGEFSVRGGIVDIYPATHDPVRLELAGDDIDSLRTFDLDTQRSTGSLAEATILPRRPATVSRTIVDALPAGSFLVLQEPAQIALHAQEGGQDGDLLPWKALAAGLAERPCLTLVSWGEPKPSALALAAEPINSAGGRIEDWVKEVARRQRDGQRILVVSQQAARLREVLEEHQVPGVVGAGPLEAGRIQVLRGALSEGVHLRDAGLAVMTDREILGRPRRRRVFKTWERAAAYRLEDLHDGDFMVHLQHGIGLFRGLTSVDLEGMHRDFLAVEYAKGDKLYVPVDQMDLLQKYVGADGRAPALSRLGGSEWARTKKTVEAAMQEMAAGLLEVAAKRETAQGFACDPDTPWQAELEAAFPYDETPDQVTAIAAVKADMERPRPMDRLICGDAGYGKTEVALRAAFKAVMAGKQVALLVPTTVLAQQHYTTFRERLAPYPTQVEMLSRFRSHKEQQDTLARVAAGAVEVIIGTHRLLQKDVAFKDLGLVIVDEEQHFGVAHKEQLKALRQSVDVLTLTATPIPRTLHMALAGIRELCVIETPPQDRLPIKTYVLESHPDIFTAAITRELEREGQIFVVHNRVQGIERLAQDLRRRIPQARIAVAHGQMPEDQLEQVMLEFTLGAHDVLVCTTIVESGLDIPNVNTILVNNAHLFGLAQLYQLRGRVGRASHQAYCYLLYPPQRTLSDAAEARLSTLREFTHLGAGLQIALRDLEIRGAGNLLGAEQSGSIAAVGFDLYCQLLQEQVQRLRGEPATPRGESPILDLPVQAYLPDAYVGDPRQKVDLYRKLASAARVEDLAPLREELADRYGPPPAEVDQLLALVRLRILAIAAQVPRIRVVAGELRALVPFVDAISAQDVSAMRELTGAAVHFADRELRVARLLEQPDWLIRLGDLVSLLPPAGAETV